MNGGDIQHLTPLMEVLCGFNVAFALWDGFTKKVTRYENELADVKEAIEKSLLAAKAAKAAKVDLKVTKAIRRRDQLRKGINKINDGMSLGRKCGLGVALVIMVALAAVGVYPELKSGLSELWWKIGVTFLFIVFSLAPAAVTWRFIWLEWRKLGKGGA